MGDEAKSLKGLFQGMVPTACELVQGTVISISPLRIQMENDAKLIVGPASVVVPQHLTTHTVKVTIPASGGHSQYVGSGVHSHSEVTMTVYNALKVGDKVHLLAVQNSKKYFVLDRAG
jgi:hypothetical protein